MHIDQLKEKLIKSSLNCTMARITTFDRQGDRQYHTGLIFYRPDVDERFQIFDGDTIDLMFKPEAVVKFELMTDVWHTHCHSDVINYNEEA